MNCERERSAWVRGVGVAAFAGMTSTVTAGRSAAQHLPPDNRQAAPTDSALTADAPSGHDAAARRTVPSGGLAAESVGPGLHPARPSTARPIETLIAEAVRTYRMSSVAPTVRAGAVTAYPFAHAEAMLGCRVLRACVVELEPGERLVAPPLAGDQARWLIEYAPSGSDDGSAIVAVKPKQCGITTNVVIATDRRVYDVDLISAPCVRRAVDGDRAESRGARYVRFYYPDGDRSPAAAPAGQSVPLAASAAPRPDTAAPATPDALVVNRAYRVVRGRRFLFWREPVRFPWRPSAVWDDGAHVYIALPLEARRHAAPVLYAIEEDGSRALVNYTIAGSAERPTYVTDRTFRRAALVIASGKSEQRLVLENRAWLAAAPSSPHLTSSTAGTP